MPLVDGAVQRFDTVPLVDGAVQHCDTVPLVDGAVPHCDTVPLVDGAVPHCDTVPLVNGAVPHYDTVPLVDGAAALYLWGFGFKCWHWYCLCKKLHGFPWSLKINTKLLLEQRIVTCFSLPSWQAIEPKGSGFMSSQIMTPAEARRDTKNLFHEMSVFALQNLTDLTEQDGSVNSKVQSFCKSGYKRSNPIRAGNLLINSCCRN